MNNQDNTQEIKVSIKYICEIQNILQLLSIVKINDLPQCTVNNVAGLLIEKVNKIEEEIMKYF